MYGKINLCKVLFYFVFLALIPPAFTAGPLLKWCGSGVIRPQGEAKYKAVFLPETVYEYAANDLRDLRLTDANGETLPYILERGYLTSKSQEVIFDTEFLREFAKKGATYFDFKVQHKEEALDPAGNKLQVTLPPLDFYKEAEVYGSHDGVRWNYLSTGSLYRIKDLKQDSIPLAETERYSFYRLKLPAKHRADQD